VAVTAAPNLRSLSGQCPDSEAASFSLNSAGDNWNCFCVISRCIRNLLLTGIVVLSVIRAQIVGRSLAAGVACAAAIFTIPTRRPRSEAASA